MKRLASQESAAVKELCDAVEDVLGILNFYIGPAARTAVSSESRVQYDRLVAARRAVLDKED